MNEMKTLPDVDALSIGAIFVSAIMGLKPVHHIWHIEGGYNVTKLLAERMVAYAKADVKVMSVHIALYEHTTSLLDDSVSATPYRIELDGEVLHDPEGNVVEFERWIEAEHFVEEFIRWK